MKMRIPHKSFVAGAATLTVVSLLAMGMSHAADGPTAPIGFRGQQQSSANSTTVTVSVPPGVAAGDALVLFVSANRGDVTLATPNGDPSWHLLNTAVDQSMATGAWWTVADPGDEGGAVIINASGQTKLDAQLLAYLGTDPTDPVAGFTSDSETVLRSQHTTPVQSPASAGSWTVSYWADKSSSSTGWAPLSGLAQRGENVGSGGGRIGSLSGDSNGPDLASSIGGHQAVSTAESDKATMWTVALKPSGSDPAPPPSSPPPSSPPPSSPPPSSPPPAPQTGAIASWDFEETGGSIVVDSSGHGRNLTRGTAIEIGVPGGTSLVHRFPWITTTAPASADQRLHTIADLDALDPNSGTFVVSLRFKTGVSARNIVQKGQSTTTGGFWKVEIGGRRPDGMTGQARCLFRGSNGDSYTYSGTISVTDNQWHDLVCVNHAAGSYMLIDGTRRTSTTPSGYINNNKHFVIGGKYSCDNVTVSCDYFVGDIDYVRIGSVAP